MISGLSWEEMQDTLGSLGRLAAYTRQLDAAMRDDGAVERLAADFLSERYGGS